MSFFTPTGLVASAETMQATPLGFIIFAVMAQFALLKNRLLRLAICPFSMDAHACKSHLLLFKYKFFF